MTAVAENRLKSRMAEGETVFVTFIRLPEPGIVEILGHAGFDGVIVDFEHGSVGWAELEGMVFAASATGIALIVRPTCNEPARIMRALDLGAAGILAPHICDRDGARMLRRGALFPPEGERGAAIGRPARWGAIPARDYFRTMNEQVLVGAMIEDREAVERIDDIAGERLDFMFFGSTDIASSLGVPGEFDHPEVLALRERMVAASRDHGIPAGTIARDTEAAMAAVSDGFQLIALGTAETLLMQHCRTILSTVKASHQQEYRLENP